MLVYSLFIIADATSDNTDFGQFVPTIHSPHAYVRTILFFFLSFCSGPGIADKTSMNVEKKCRHYQTLFPWAVSFFIFCCWFLVFFAYSHIYMYIYDDDNWNSFCVCLLLPNLPIRLPCCFFFFFFWLAGHLNLAVLTYRLPNGIHISAAEFMKRKMRVTGCGRRWDFMRIDPSLHTGALSSIVWNYTQHRSRYCNQSNAYHIFKIKIAKVHIEGHSKGTVDLIIWYQDINRAS